MTSNTKCEALSLDAITDALVSLAESDGRDAVPAHRLLRAVEHEHFEHETPVPESVNEYIWERKRLRVGRYHDWRTIDGIPEHLVEWARAQAKLSPRAAWEILDLVQSRLTTGGAIPAVYADYLGDGIRTALGQDKPSLDKALGLAKATAGQPRRLLLSDPMERRAVERMARLMAEGAAPTVNAAAEAVLDEFDPDHPSDPHAASRKFRNLYSEFGQLVCVKPTETWNNEDAARNWPLRILRLLTGEGD